MAGSFHGYIRDMDFTHENEVSDAIQCRYPACDLISGYHKWGPFITTDKRGSSNLFQDLVGQRAPSSKLPISKINK